VHWNTEKGRQLKTVNYKGENCSQIQAFNYRINVDDLEFDELCSFAKASLRFESAKLSINITAAVRYMNKSSTQ